MIKFYVYEEICDRFHLVNLADLNENQPAHILIEWPDHISTFLKYRLITKWAYYNNIDLSFIYVDGICLKNVTLHYDQLYQKEHRALFNYYPAKFKPNYK